MKWTENGVSFEGTVNEYKELHADGFLQVPQRTRTGRHVSVIVGDNTTTFQTVKDAAEWISQQTARYISASALGKALDESNRVCIDRFRPNVGSDRATLFENNSNDEGEKDHAE